MYSTFLDKFPKIQYDINNSLFHNYETVGNIFYRIGIIKNVLNNTSAYYVYEIGDEDTPELLANSVYEDPGAYWIILYANDMMDPYYDWPLNYTAFQNYIISKYGSIEAAKTTIHHYEKVITRTLTPDNVISETRFIVDKQQLTQNNLNVPYDTYDELAIIQSVETFDIDGKTITQITKGEPIYCYDYEEQLNEDKRTIKVIKADYYDQIMNELNNIITNNKPFNRRLV